MPFFLPWSKVTCPFCLQRFRLSEAPWRNTKLTANVIDDKHDDFLEIPKGNRTERSPVIPAFKPSFSFSVGPLPKFLSVDPSMEGKLEGYSLKILKWIYVVLFILLKLLIWSLLKIKLLFHVRHPPDNQKLICPSCHCPLPVNIASGKAAGEIIAIIGSRNSGKSSFFGVLIQQLRTRYMKETDFTIRAVPSYYVNGEIHTKRLYEERYGQYLFNPNNPQVVPITPPAEGMNATDPRVPLIYELLFRRQGVQGVQAVGTYTHRLLVLVKRLIGSPFLFQLQRLRCERIPIYLMIYDAAGEGMLNNDVLQSYQFILQATAIIFLIDPFDYPGVRSQLPDKIIKNLPKEQPKPAQVVNQVIDLYQNHRRLPAAGQLNIPVAFALTKSDMFEDTDLVERTSSILRDSVHKRGYDKVGCDALNDEIITLIEQWDSAELIQIANSHFSNHRFFAVSALGNRPNEKDGTLQAINPRRIADPLFWVLHELGYLPVAENNRVERKQ